MSRLLILKVWLVVMLLAAIGMAFTGFCQEARAATFRAVDDLSVDGSSGDKNDPDLEVKGVSSLAKDTFIESGILAGPYGGLGSYGNMLTYSEEFNQTSEWTASGVSVTANSVAAPDGQTTADSIIDDLTGGGTVTSAAKSITAAKPYTFSVWLKGTSAQSISLKLTDNAATPTSTTQNITLDTTWKRYSVSHTPATGSTTLTATINHTTATSDTFYAWAGQLEQSSTPGVYVRTTTAAISADRGGAIIGNLHVIGSIYKNGSEFLGGYWTQSGSNLYYTTGNVGIGTTVPGQALDVVGQVKASVGFQSGTGASAGFYDIADSGGTQRYAVARSTGTANALIIGDGTNLGAKVGIGYGVTETIPQMLSVDGTGYFTGNVGIGTTAPAGQLHVVGNAIRLDGSNIDIYDSTGATQYWRMALRSGDFQIEDSQSTTIPFNIDVGADTDSLTIQADGDVIMNGGNVGIGTANPIRTVDIINASTPNLRLVDSTANASIQLSVGDADSSVEAQVGDLYLTTGSADQDIIFKNTTNNLAIVKASGSVGIGTTSPEAKLDVEGTLQVGTAGDTGVAHDLVMTNIDSSTIKSYGPLAIESGGSNDNYNLTLKGSGTGKVYIDDDLEITGDLTLPALSIPASGTVTFGTDTNLYRSAADTLKTDDTLNISGNLQVTGTGPHYISTGNVGIGTTGPTEALHVAGGSDSSTDGILLAGQRAIMFRDTSSRIYEASGLNLRTGNSARPLTFGITGENMRIHTDGNVGIGDTTPTTAKLVVNGGIDASYIGAGWPPNSSYALLVHSRSSSQHAARIRGASGQTADILAVQNSDSSTNYFTVGPTKSYFAGNIGIGTTGPTNLLHVYGGNGEGVIIRSGSDTLRTINLVNGTGDFTSDNSGGAVLKVTGTGTADLVNIVDGSTQVFTILDGGNVGIGATGPGNLLELQSDAANFGISFRRSNVADMARVEVTDAGFGGHLDFYTNPAGADSPETAYTRMRIDSTGLVGIGTTSPTEKLDVRGSVVTPIGMLQTPYGGLGRYENLLTYSEEFNQTSEWTATGVTVTANSVASPDGQTTADSIIDDLTGGGTLDSTAISATAGKAYTFSVWIKGTSSQSISLKLTDNATTPTSTTQNITLDTNWQRHSVTHTLATGATTIKATINHTSSASDTFYTWGAQLEQSSSPGVYAKTTSSTVSASRGLVSTGDILMPSLKLSGGTITDTTGAVTVGSDLHVTGDGPHYISSGNVGIGTTNPNALFNIIGTNGQPVIADFQNDNNNIRTQIRGDEGNNFGGYYYYGGGSGFSFDYSGNPRIGDAGGTSTWMFIDKTTGNVGIGTTAPGSTRLRVVSSTGEVFKADDGSTAVIRAKADGTVTFEKGNVGIGTTGPGTLLQIKTTGAGGSGGTDLLELVGNDGGTWTFDQGGAILKNTRNNPSYLNAASGGGQWRFQTAGNTRMTISSTGNVGIGTTSPGSYRLNVTGGNILADYGALYLNNTGGTAQIQFGASGSYDTNLYRGGANTLKTDDRLVVAGTGDTTIAGNVGIGTTGPGYKLDIAGGDARITGKWVIQRTSSSNFIDLTDTTNSQTYSLVMTSGDLRFVDDGVERVTIQNGGNVGIGTTNPGAKFEVAGGGAIIANGLTVSAGTVSLPDNSIALADINWGAGKVVLEAEYPTSVFSADGADNNGVMTADNTRAGGTGIPKYMNYMQWSSSQATLQDYDIVIRYTLPDDFSDWPTSDAIVIDFCTQETSVEATSSLDVSIYNSDGNQVSTKTGQYSTTAAQWAQVSFSKTDLTGGTYTLTGANAKAIIVLHAQSKSSKYLRIGDVTINYTR